MNNMTDKDSSRKQEKKRVSRKYLSLFLLMSVWGVFIILKMGIVMFGERQYWTDVSRNMTPVNRVIEARRGNILSDEGLLLASSMKQYRVFLDFRTSEKTPQRAEKDQMRKDTLFNKHLAEFARQMHDIFPNYSVQEFADHYKKGFEFEHGRIVWRADTWKTEVQVDGETPQISNSAASSFETESESLPVTPWNRLSFIHRSRTSHPPRFTPRTRTPGL